MRTDQEIMNRLRTYENNLNHVKDIPRINVIKQAIIELSWVLGEESNHKFNCERR